VFFNNIETEKQSLLILDYYKQDLQVAKNLQFINTNFVKIKDLLGLAIQDEDDLYLEDALTLVNETNTVISMMQSQGRLISNLGRLKTNLGNYYSKSEIYIKLLLKNEYSETQLDDLRLALSLYKKSYLALEKAAENSYTEHQQQYITEQESVKLYSYEIVALLLVIMCTASYFFIQSIVSALQTAQSIASSIAEGQWDIKIDTQREDEPGTLLKAIDKMRVSLKKSQRLQVADAEILNELNRVSSADSYQSVARTFRENMNVIAFAIYHLDNTDSYTLLAADSIDNKVYSTNALTSIGIIDTLRHRKDPIFITQTIDELSENIDLGFTDLTVHSISAWPVIFRDESVGAVLISHMTAFNEYQQNIMERGISQLATRIKGLRVESERESLIIDLAEKTDVLKKKSVEAEQASTLKSEFISTMSHELRTPMNAIIGFTNILLKSTTDRLNEREIRSLRTIDSSASHLLDLINSILDISKIESGQFDLNVSMYDLVSLIEDCLREVAALATPKNLAVTFTTFSQECFIEGDARRIKQTALNFLSNAIKFTDEGSINVQLSQGIGAMDNGILLIFEDTGIGIKDEDKGKLFQKFMQLDGSHTRAAGGTGLGLAISKEFIALHGGSIQWESTFGVGSRFEIYLPYTCLSAADSNPRLKLNS